MEMILNFSHPLSASSLQQLKSVHGFPDDLQVVDRPAQFDTQLPFAPQVDALIGDATGSEVLVLPALNFAAALMVAIWHKRFGSMPVIIRTRPVKDGLVTIFEPAEVIALNDPFDALV